MTYNTGNPIGSTDARDRSDNSENLDLAVNSLSPTFVDRLGVTRDTLEGIYQKSAYYRVGTFDAGYTLTNNRQTLAYGNIEYSWSGSFPKVVAAGSTPAPIESGSWVDRTSVTLRSELAANDGTKYIGGLDVIFFSNYNPPDNVVVTGDKFSGYTLVSGADCTALFQQAVLDAQAAGKPLDLGSGNYLLSGATITAASGSCKIIGQSGYCNIYINGWTNKTTTSDMSLTAYTQFIFPMDGAAYGDNLKSTLTIQGISFHNLDNTKISKVFSAQYGMEQLEVSYCDAYNFTAFGRAGWNCVTDGVHAGSDAQTTIKHTVIYNNCVDSDSYTTGQCPKTIHLYQCSDTHTAANRFIGRGNGFVYRQNGGNYDTIPVAGRGSCNAKFIGNHVYTEHTGSEYDQYSKTVGIVIANNTFNASYGAAPHNFMDLFNCQNVTFTGNAGVGGGLLFLGHADLNNGSYPANLVGSRGLVATGNSIINPSHTSIFNFGGDGTVDGNRSFLNATISNNTVSVLPGYTVPQNCYFVYAFLAGDINLSGNTVQAIKGYFNTYYCRRVTIDNEHLVNVPQEIYNSGNDTTTFTVGKLRREGTTGTETTFIGQSILKTSEIIGPQRFKSAVTMDADITLNRAYTDYKSSGYVSNGSVTLTAAKISDIGLYDLNIGLVASAGSATYGKYFIQTTGTTGGATALVANANITITLTVTSTTVSVLVSQNAGTRTLYATLTRVL